MSATEHYRPVWSWWDFKVHESDADDQDFGGYTLAFTADSPATLESSLNPAELVPFQGCVIPPLSPQWDLSAEDSLVSSHAEAHDGALWEDVAQCQAMALGDSVEANNLLHATLKKKEEAFKALQERNVHLRQLADRAKHLASVLERLMTVRHPCTREPAAPHAGKPSLSPCKRQRLDEGYETESSDSVEDILRDVSTRCNAVLHGGGGGGAAVTTKTQQEAEVIRMHGSFSGLKTSVCSTTSLEGTEGEEGDSSFRTSIREHGTIRTQAHPHGRTFTSCTQQGRYRFRWVPNHS
ncbi:multicilin isoform X2 [Nelusetta ayraudi]|uniref:multicilin isoform X2 n=1 Tax=Nelusetta ayraudi TaxID=303726 RepID=UPI003F72C7BE